MTIGLVGLCVVLVQFAGCSSDGGADPASQQAETAASPIAPIAVGEAPLRVEMIRAAIAAVEAELGGPQRYFEVNATPTIVNLFVAAQDASQAVAYVYGAGALEPPEAPQPASGPTFGSTDIDFDETLVLARVDSELASSDFRLFSITGVEAGGVTYRAVIDSTKGTEFVVFLNGQGAVLGTDQNLAGGGS